MIPFWAGCLIGATVGIGVAVAATYAYIAVEMTK